MCWPIFRATCTCGRRRLCRVHASSPLLGVLVALAAGGLPGVAFWAGSRLSDEFAAEAATPGFTSLVAASVGVSAAVAGLTVALLAPGLEALGPQLAAAPQRRIALAAGAVVGPVCAAAGICASLLLFFAVPLAGGVGLVLGLVALACGALGAAFGEGARLAVAGEPAGIALLALTALAWSAVGAVGSGGVFVGPAAVVGARWAVPVLTACVAVGVAIWLVGCGAGRRERASTRQARRRRLPARAVPALAVATFRRVLRHPELRLHGATAVALPVAVVVAARVVLGVDGSAATVFCAAVALTATALYPSAALGFAQAARWLLAAAPRRRDALAAAAAVGGIGAAAVLVAAAALLAAPLGAPDLSTAVELESATAFVLGAGTLAGAVVPWHPQRVLNQLAAYAAALVFVGGGWLAVGRLAPFVADPTVFAVVVGHVVLVVGVVGAAVIAR